VSASAPSERPEGPVAPRGSRGGEPVAWCEACERPVEADAGRDGVGNLICPNCGSVVVPTGDDEEDEPPKAPWHFKVLLVGTVGYLVYRVIWFIGWLHHHA
jgi:hypothetical protein